MFKVGNLYLIKLKDGCIISLMIKKVVLIMRKVSQKIKEKINKIIVKITD